MFKEYKNYDALGLAKLVKDKQVSPKELLDAAIAQANAQNPKLNAIIHRFDERAFRELNSGLPQGVFHGVPFLLKDLMQVIEGEPYCMGSRGVHMVPDYDCELVKRYKASGVNTFGKTNTPEFGLIITTEPKAYGATHNPFKTGYSSGGSSGGSAAAVSAGIVPMAGANDGGGSIRFPSAWCGVFGLKPSRGRNPIGPDAGELWNGASIDHVITRSVRDSAAMLDVTHGHEIGAPYNIAPPTGSFLEAALRSPKQLRVALTSTPLVKNTKVDTDVLVTLKRTAKQLESMGHIVEEATPNINIDTLWHDFSVVVSAYTSFMCHDLEMKLGKQVTQNLEPMTRNMAMLGRSLSARDLVAAKQGWHDIQYRTGQFLTNYDLILCPTVPTPAVKHGVLPPSRFDELSMSMSANINIGKLAFKTGLVEKLSHPVLSKMAFTMLGNITGLPCASLPLGMSKKGLPIGMQLIGRMGDEETLLSVAGDFERAGLFTQPAFAKKK